MHGSVSVEAYSDIGSKLGRWPLCSTKGPLLFPIKDRDLQGILRQEVIM